MNEDVFEPLDCPCESGARPGRNAAQTRLRILKNAEKLFSRYPYELVSLRRVADMSGVNVALISRYYGSKKDLFRAVFESISSRRPPLSDENKLGDLAGRIVRSFESGFEDDGLLELLNILMLSSMSQEASPVIQEKMQSFLTDIEKTEGEGGVPPARILTSCILGMLLLRRLLPEGVPPTVSTSEMREALRILRHALDCRSPGAPL